MTRLAQSVERGPVERFGPAGNDQKAEQQEQRRRDERDLHPAAGAAAADGQLPPSAWISVIAAT